MTADKKEQAIALLKQALETIQDRAYAEIAEIPTEGQDDFQVKYSFLHDHLEGIFTVVGKLAPRQSGGAPDRFSLSDEFDQDSSQHNLIAAQKKVNQDLLSAEAYLNAQISGQEVNISSN
ncbi:hypothetical protein ACS5PU_16680 [Pedobacter sp. GSP4]|uniref:hypothetical protein n=1 Tax=Pedobacter sp. GSP4 TaxID=3453716 RepID=UPI003EE9A4EA